MAFGYARRRRDELEQASEKPPADDDLLARFAYVETDNDAPDEVHVHNEVCHCGLRGE